MFKINEDKHIAVIGSGPAGCTAALYLARAGYCVNQFTGATPGGQLTTTADVENYPGFLSINGAELVMKMQNQAQKYGVNLLRSSITGIDISSRPFGLIQDGGARSFANAVIIATGAQAKWLGLKSEDEFRNYGVSSCATCDGFFYRGKRVAVIGGGNTAVEEALILANFVESVTLIHRRDTLKAEKILQDRLFAHPKITCVWNAEVLEILGSENPKHVTGIRIKSMPDGTQSEIELDGVFVAIGHAPQSAAFADVVQLDEYGYIKTAPDSAATSTPGIFAAGDVRDSKYRQAITAAGQGCMAAIEAANYLDSKPLFSYTSA